MWRGTNGPESMLGLFFLAKKVPSKHKGGSWGLSALPRERAPSMKRLREQEKEDIVMGSGSVNESLGTRKDCDWKMKLEVGNGELTEDCGKRSEGRVLNFQEHGANHHCS